MKSFRVYLKEAERKKQKLKDKEVDWFGSDDIFKQQDDQPLSTIAGQDDSEVPTADARNKVSQRDTLRATQTVEPNQRMRDLLGRMRDIEADDEEGYPDQEPENLPSTQVNTQNLPAVAGQALQASGVQNPDFHKVANLPGNMSRAIRTLGKQLFGAFTRTDTKDIWMIGNLNGQGPNSRQEVNAVAGWAREHGEDIGTGDIDFDTSIPGYSAEIQQYSAGGIRWLVVRDEFGDYVYSWPERDSLQQRNRGEIGRDTARLSNG
jgi:hypothetical protein